MKKRSFIYLVLGILIQLFIWTNSLLLGTDSSQLSGGVTEFISTILSKLGFMIELNDLSFWIRKLAHFTQFFIFGLVWFKIFTFKHSPYLLTLLYGALVATLDEGIQLFVEGRNGSIVDVGIDTLGILMSLFVWFIVRKYILRVKA